MRISRIRYLFLFLAFGLVGFQFQTKEDYVKDQTATVNSVQAEDTAAVQQNTASENLSTASEEKDFQKALDDTKVATYGEISRNLTPIVSYNTNLTWNGGKVLMTAWADDYYKRFNVGEYMTVSSAHEIWVFPPHEMKNFLKKNKVAKKQLQDRLKKLLGLRPESKNTLFVEFWVTPYDMYRPSPDPETSDNEAELDFPGCPYSSISQAYKDWFNNRKATIYTGSHSYPWTGLGYTYDWGSRNHIGLSEYVIKGGALVQIKSITPTESYK
jgi:hypothetical protein